jgi:hypothetical protein
MAPRAQAHPRHIAYPVSSVDKPPSAGVVGRADRTERAGPENLEHDVRRRRLCACRRPRLVTGPRGRGSNVDPSPRGQAVRRSSTMDGHGRRSSPLIRSVPRVLPAGVSVAPERRRKSIGDRPRPSYQSRAAKAHHVWRTDLRLRLCLFWCCGSPGEPRISSSGRAERGFVSRAGVIDGGVVAFLRCPRDSVTSPPPRPGRKPASSPSMKLSPPVRRELARPERRRRRRRHHRSTRLQCSPRKSSSSTSRPVVVFRRRVGGGGGRGRPVLATTTVRPDGRPDAACARPVCCDSRAS